jgi:proteasome lid subunit RPN8/RPN11
MGKQVSNERVLQAIPDEVWVLARAHTGEQLENEVGGFLIGFLTEDGLKVTHALPAREAVGSAAQLTFPPEAWTSVYAVIEERNQGERLVGWYHSHPGHGVFLSAYDEFIHTQFFPEEGQVAMVIDPQTGDEGVFVTRNKKIQEVVKRSGTKAKGQTAAQKAAKRDRRSLFFRAGAVVILVGAFYTFGLIRSGYNSGFTDGDTAGYDRGFGEGDTAGYDRGFGEGDTAGYDRGFGEGDAAGFDRGDSAGYLRGYKAGRTFGYTNGVQAGTKATAQEYAPFVPEDLSGAAMVQLLIEYGSEAEATSARSALAIDSGVTAEVISLEARWYLKVQSPSASFIGAPSAVQNLALCVAKPSSCNP